MDFKRFKPKTPTFVSNAYTVHEPNEFLLVDTGAGLTLTVTLRANPEDGEEFYLFCWAGTGGTAIQPATGGVYISKTPTTPVGVGGNGSIHLIFSAELASWLQLYP